MAVSVGPIPSIAANVPDKDLAKSKQVNLLKIWTANPFQCRGVKTNNIWPAHYHPSDGSRENVVCTCRYVSVFPGASMMF